MRLTWQQAAVGVGALLLGACHDSPTSPEMNRLAVAESRWHATAPASRTYSMRQQVSCFCVYGGATFQLTVVANNIVRASNVNTGVELSPEQRQWFRTIDQLFEAVRSALKAPDTLREVTYDAVYGYPTLVSLDPIKNAIDDEVAYLSSGFAVAP